MSLPPSSAGEPAAAASAAGGAPRPPDEPARLRALEQLRLLDTPPDAVLDGLVRCAAAAAGCPMAFITLVDADRQWFKARCGFDAVQTPRDVAFSTHTILGSTLLEVHDAQADPRFAGNRLVVSEPLVRFYAGLPLAFAGHAVGSLCVLDTRPRRLDAAQRTLLHDLGRAIEARFAAWHEHRLLAEASEFRKALLDQIGDGVLLLDRRHHVLDANARAAVLTGYTREELLQLRLPVLLAPEERRRLDADVPRMMAGITRLIEWEQQRKDGSRFAAEVSARPLDSERYLVVLRNMSRRHAQAQQLRQLSLAVDQTSEGILITDLHGDIEFVNRAALRRTGYSRHELIGRNARLLRSPRNQAGTYRTLWAHLSAGQAWQGRVVSQHKDGGESVEQLRILPVRDTHGSVRQFLVVQQLPLAAASAPRQPEHADAQRQDAGEREG